MDPSVLSATVAPLAGLIDDATTMVDVGSLLDRVRQELDRFEPVERSIVVLLEGEIAQQWTLSNVARTVVAGEWLIRPDETVEGHCALEALECRIPADQIRRPASDGEPWTHDRPLVSEIGDECHELLVFPLCSSRGAVGSFTVQTTAPLADSIVAELRAIAAIVTMVLEKTTALRELDERQAAQSRVNTDLAATNSELETVARMASSELHQPLGQIRNYANRLGNLDDGLTEREADYLQRIVGASSRMQTLVGDLLTFSRVSTVDDPSAAVSLNQVVGEALMDLELLISDAGGVVTVDELPVVDGNATQLRQLFQNLIGNAIKYRRSDVAPRVAVRCVEAGPGLVTIEVEDNGIGFEQRFVDRIFKPFQRLHGRGEFDGSGIGLAVCRRIVERHGGSMAARSVPGEGSVFIVTFETGSNA